MSRRQKKMIVRAQKRFGRIFPCGKCRSFSECFTRTKDRVVFWYNTADGSTHVVV